MAHEWTAGVLTTSSWHGLEEVGELIGAEGMIAAGEYSGAWPTSLRFDEVRTLGGLVAPGRAIVASYKGLPDACLSVVGDRYRATTPEEWRVLVQAATAAGARPTGAFSLRGGTRALATFEVGQANGLRTQLLLADSFDGSMRLTCGTTSIRVVCANTLSASLSADGAGMAKLRHTASLEQKVAALAESIGSAIEHGEKVREAYHAAEKMKLSRGEAYAAFDRLFPLAPVDATKGAKTRAENERTEAQRAMALPVNNAGSTLATIWNAATYLVDRTVDGAARPIRGDEALDSMLFGARAARIEEIQTMIGVIMRDGTTRYVPAPEAIRMGANGGGSVAASLLDEILATA